jgi:dCMP deaminase
MNQETKSIKKTTEETTVTISDVTNVIKNINIRPSWDQYFIAISHLISQRSTCERLHVGCVIVKDNRTVTTGYNGFISGAPHVGFIRDNHEQMTIHAETNAIADAAKRGVELDGSIAYITHCPCINCCKILIASGIKKIIYSEDYKNDELVFKLCETGNVEITKFDPECNY